MRILFAVAALAVATPTLADTFVNGHVRRDGTYVQPHVRSNPDGNRSNNWSTQGNQNPYTGQQGTRDPYAASPPNSFGGSNNNFSGQRLR